MNRRGAKRFSSAAGRGSAEKEVNNMGGLGTPRDRNFRTVPVVVAPKPAAFHAMWRTQSGGKGDAFNGVW
jgi:hypothetical protein